MPRRAVSFTAAEFYHVYNRGNDRRSIFYTPENYRYFKQKFLEYLPSHEVEIHAYCLMPNHYHFLIRLLSDFDLSKKMNHLAISYVKAVNKRYAKSGHLFEGRFKGKHVDSMEYLLHLSRYIHLNPRFAGLVKKAEDWEFSSYREYLSAGQIWLTTGATKSEISGDRLRLPVSTEYVLSHFEGSEGYREFVESFAEEQMRQIDDQLWG
jgi:putative transposase